MSKSATETGEIHYSRYLGSFPRIKSDRWMIAGQDGGQSIDLGEQTLFLFADTLVVRSPSTTVSDQKDARMILANCAGLSSGTNLRKSLTEMCFYQDESGDLHEVIQATAQERENGIRFWPAHGVYLDGRVYLYYLGIEMVDGYSQWNFRNLGAGLAVMNLETGECQRFRRSGEWRLWNLEADDFHFGVQVVRNDDDLFVFGSVRRDFQTQAILSRVSVDQIEDLDAYEYLQEASDSWGSEIKTAGSLGDCGGDYSVSYNAYLSQYVMVYIDSYTKTLIMRLAEAITGPYSEPQKIGRVPHHPSSDLAYLGFEHPKFAQDNGQRIFVSYCQPSFTQNNLLEIRFR